MPHSENNIVSIYIFFYVAVSIVKLCLWMTETVLATRGLPIMGEEGSPHQGAKT